MKTPKNMVVMKDQLPMTIELVGTAGERRTYVLSASGRKFGASLQAPNTLAK